MAATTERVDSPLRSASSASGASTSAPRLALRAMSGWEEEHVQRHQADTNTARLCNEILARCLVPPGEDPGAARQTVAALLVGERDRELVELRRLSLGPAVSAQVVCPSCGETSDAEFSLDTLPLDLPSSPRRVSLEIPELGDVTLRLPTAGDQEELLDADLETEAEQFSWLLARCLERVGERSGAFDVDFARNLPVGVRHALDAALQVAIPALDLEMAVECSHCRAPIVAPFDVSSFFFELTARAAGLLRDVHTLARAYHWSERDIVGLSLGRRLAYLMLLEVDADAALLAELSGETP